MAETIHCPDCDRAVSVPERLFGKRVRCPSCKAIFTAESPVVDVEVVEDEAPPRSPARKPARRDHDEDKEEAPRRKRRVEEEEEAAAPPHRRNEEHEEERQRRVRPKKEDEDEIAERTRGRRRPAEEDEEDEEEPRPQRKRPKLTGDMVWGWKRVRSGLVFVLAAAVVAVLANIGGVLGFRALVDLEAQVPRTDAPFTTELILLVVIYFLACTVAVGLAMTGNIICMAIPEPKTARSTLTSSLAMMALGLFLFLGGVIYLWVRVAIWRNKIPLYAATDVPHPPLEGIVVYIFGATLLLAQPGVFSLFVRNAAQGVRQSGLAISLIFQAIAPALIALAFAIAAMSMYSALTGDAVNREAGDAGWTTVKILYFVEFGYAAWFITSLILTHLAITRHIERR
jgi:hypothetical protein